MNYLKRFSPVLFGAFVAFNALWWILGTAFQVIMTLLTWFINIIANVQPLNRSPIRNATNALVDRSFRLVAAIISGTFTKFSKVVRLVRWCHKGASMAFPWALACVGFIVAVIRLVCAIMTGQIGSETKSTKTEKGDQRHAEGDNKNTKEKKRKSRKVREKREKRLEMKRRGKRINRRAIERLEKENMRIRRRNKRIEVERKEREAKIKAEHREEVEKLNARNKDLENQNNRYNKVFTGLDQDIQASRRYAKTVSYQLSEAQDAYRKEKKKRVARDMEICALRRRLAEERELTDTLKSRVDRSACLLAQNEQLRRELFQLRVETAQNVETGAIEVEVKESVDVGKDMESLMTVMEKLLEQHGNDVEGWRCGCSPLTSLVVSMDE